MQIETINTDQLLIVRFNEKRLEARAVAKFPETINSSLRNNIKKIVLNLTKTEFIDSSGLGAIVAILKSLGNGGEVAVCSENELVTQMFKLTRMDQIFNVLACEEDAVSDHSIVNHYEQDNSNC